MRVKIYTFSDKAPYFIPWQYKTLKNFVTDDFEYIVMNNSSSKQLDEDIRNHCSSLAIKSIDVKKKDFTHACFSCAFPIQECIDEIIAKDKDCYSVILDSDIFLMKPFSFNEFMDGWDIAGVPQSRDGGYSIIEYMWNAFVIIDNDTCPRLDTLNFSCGTVMKGKLDVGGMTYFYFKQFPEVKWRRIPSTGIIHDHPDVMSLLPERVRKDYVFDFDMEVLEGRWLHFRGGSRWDVKKSSYYENKEAFIRKMVEYE